MSAKVATQTKAAKPAGEELKDAIKRQVEFYFSRANLANDAFLVSQMNSQMYVPVDTIIGFGKIKQLTDSTSLLVESIQDSKVVSLNETKDAIKPNVKSERNTIILREIPSATKPEDVQAIFEGCGEVVSVRSDVGDTWFVTLASEEEAVNTLLALRSKTFNDAPIKARLKSENVLKSFYPAPVAAEPVAAASGHVVGGAYNRGYYATAATGYYDMQNNYGVQYAPGPRGQYNSAPRQGGRGAGGQQARQNGGGRGNNVTVNTNAAQQQTQPKETRAKSNSFDQQQPRPASRKSKDKKAKAAAQPAATPAAAAAATTTSSKKPTPAERQPVLNSANFPPLPVPEKITEEIKFQYAHEDILEVVKHMDENDCKLADGKMDYEAHSVALTSIAHPDLLRNQRTYSIEQARDALRQGRPIRSDSIGSIDYESMMYGEDYTKEARELRKQKADAAAEDGKKKPTEAAPKAAAGATASASAAPKVLGYAAAVILGTPAPQPPVEAAKKAAPAAAAAAAGAAAGTKTKAAKSGKDADVKKAAKKGGKASEAKAAAVDETLPKSGAWGGRNFLEVVKSEPVAPPPAPVKAAASTATASAATANGKKDEWVKDKTFKDRRSSEKH